VKSLRWQDDAECAEIATEFFFPDEHNAAAGNYRRAKAICDVCPVVAECLEYALSSGERFGMWGGLTPPERLRLRGAA
jgi:WhiB family redox-sensing transcriptional regulator